MKTQRLLAVAALTLAVSGCGLLIESAANHVGVPSPSKIVAEKAPPRLLIAYDGTKCQVPEARFRHIEVGQRVTCVWTGEPREGLRPAPIF